MMSSIQCSVLSAQKDPWDWVYVLQFQEVSEDGTLNTKHWKGLPHAS
jgi:hypothetical protein